MQTQMSRNAHACMCIHAKLFASSLCRPHVLLPWRRPPHKYAKILPTPRLAGATSNPW